MLHGKSRIVAVSKYIIEEPNVYSRNAPAKARRNDRFDYYALLRTTDLLS